VVSALDYPFGVNFAGQFIIPVHVDCFYELGLFKASVTSVSLPGRRSQIVTAGL